MEPILIFFLATFTALISTSLIKKFAIRYEIGSVPDQRKVHAGFIPTMGGLGIYTGGLIGLVIIFLLQEHYWQMFTFKYLGIIVAASIMLITGIVDDVRGISAMQKFYLQILAASIVIFSGCRIERIINPFGDPINLGILSIPLTYLWLIGITNAINLLDGLDGLAAGVSLIVFSTFSVIFFLQQDWLTFSICLAMIGSILGFLRYNYHPASIFMGDTGALFLGFIIASISLKGLQKSEGNIALLVPIVTLAVPIGDTILAFFRRLNKGLHPFSADKDHLHHRLLFLGLSHRQAVHIIYFFSILFGITAYLMSIEYKIYGIILFIIMIIFAIISLNRLGYLEAQKIKKYLGDHTIVEVKKETAPLSLNKLKHKSLLIVSDLLTIHLALVITFWFRFHSGFFDQTTPFFSIDYFLHSGISLLFSFFYVLLFSLNGLYNIRWDVSRFDHVLRLSKVILFGSIIVFIVTSDPEHIFSFSRLTMLVFTVILLILMNSGRLILIFIEKNKKVLEYSMHNTLLIGATEKAKKILREIRSNPHLLYKVVGFIDKKNPKKVFYNLSYFGDYSKIPAIIREKKIEEVIIAINEKSHDEIINILSYAENFKVSFKVVPQIYDLISGHKTEEIIGHPLIRLFPDHMQPWQWIVKRMIDIIFALTGFILLMPIFIFILFLQMILGINPFLIIEDRVGKNGKIFGLLMFNTANQNNAITRFLFESYLYKIPNIVNLLFGSLTLVGPRPEMKEIVEQCRSNIKFYNRRFMIRPGITGWAQVKYRYSDTLRDRREQFKQDIFYLENMSILFDLGIILRSIFIYLFR
jgi:UDP-GlcNAc:undecaprenyl-phosphate GlcNAc-1-phosphate transferase